MNDGTGRGMTKTESTLRLRIAKELRQLAETATPNETPGILFAAEHLEASVKSFEEAGAAKKEEVAGYLLGEEYVPADQIEDRIKLWIVTQDPQMEGSPAEAKTRALLDNLRSRGSTYLNLGGQPGIPVTALKKR